MVAVYVVSYARLDEGVNMPVAPSVDTAPPTSAPPPLSLKVLVVSVEPFISIEKVADTFVFTAIPVAPLEGLVELIESVVFGGSPPPDAGAE